MSADTPSRGPVVVAIDVGASGIRGAAVDPSGRLVSAVERRDLPTQGDGRLVEEITAIVTRLRRDHRELTGIGIGAAGLVSWPHGRLGFAGNHAHGDTPLRELLAERTGLLVVVDNDANCAAWGRSALAGREGRDLLFLAVGTGLGSGLVTNGRIFRGRGGRGAEVGHVKAGRGSRAAQPSELCSCGMRGCLEQSASGAALARRGREIASRFPHGKLARRAAGTQVSAQHVIDAAKDGDEPSLDAIEILGRDLGRAVADEILPIFDVSKVVVGGGLAGAGDLLLKPLRGACEKTLEKHLYLVTPDIELVAPAEEPVLVGAGLLAHADLAGRDLDLPWGAARTATTADRRPVRVEKPVRTVLHVSPHPDDETIGASCTLLDLKAAGFRVVNLACGLGRPKDHGRRKAELQAAMAVAGFELALPEVPAAISGDDDHDAARKAITAWVTEQIEEYRPEIVVGPHPFDGHHGHETVALAVSDSVGCRKDPGLAWWMWSIWSELPRPTMISPCTEDQLAVSQQMLDCYRGENERNDYRVMLEPARALNAVRGVEQVFGYGATAHADVALAELLTEVRNDGGTWQIGKPRVRREAGARETEWTLLREWRALIGSRGSFRDRLLHRTGLQRSPARRSVPPLARV